ncbi:Por secretion system C-terminal sorting domain [Flavobacterium hibernum]|nr:Por secretion system C-terminal sorting domain [Flavobacterium hibernum]
MFFFGVVFVFFLYIYCNQIHAMAKNYFYITFLLAFFFTLSVSAQESKQLPKPQEATTIEGLSLYPNPVTNGKVYISSKNDLEKEIIVFDVLGKKVLQTHIVSRELNVSDLVPGVYIIKISEENATATRKLIIR